MHNISHKDAETKVYNETKAQMIAMMVEYLWEVASGANEVAFSAQHMLHKGLKLFGSAGKKAAMKEVAQLHDRTCFEPILPKNMTALEYKRAQATGALMYLTEKRSGEIKGRQVFNGKPTREYLSREESASPTVSLEGTTLTTVIDCKEDRDVMCVDIPNAFIQAKLKRGPGIRKVIMKITGVLVDYLIDIAPHVYADYVVYEKGRRVLYVEVIKALYGMLVAALLWYKKFRSDLEKEKFVFNPYDACVANRIVNGKQHTIRFHVDDLMSSHVDKAVNDQFAKWLQSMYGQYKAVTVHRGRKHDYLGVDYIFHKGYLEIDTRAYIKGMVKEFPVKFPVGTKCSNPARGNLFEVGNTEKLSKKKAEVYHTFVAKALYICKRGRLDIQPTVAVLCTRTKAPTKHDWKSLVQMMKYLSTTQELTRKIDVNQSIAVQNWMIDASFAVHPDFKSHTGAVNTGSNLYGGAIQTVSRKQKLNTKSSTEAELVAVDDVIVLVLWTMLFLEAQGYHVDKNIIHQDNKSAILLELNGKSSSGKRTRALNIRYFYITDQVLRGNAVIEYCPTDQMIGDFMTKPLQGRKFTRWRNAIMNSGYSPPQ